MKKKNPWIGAAYYEDPNTAEHACKFFGRDQEVSELLQFVDNNICTTLYGKSGIGKTSILNAGLFPRLRKAKYFPVYIRLGCTEKAKSTPEEETTKRHHVFSGTILPVTVSTTRTNRLSSPYLYSTSLKNSLEGTVRQPAIFYDK